MHHFNRTLFFLYPAAYKQLKTCSGEGGDYALHCCLPSFCCSLSLSPFCLSCCLGKLRYTCILIIAASLALYFCAIVVSMGIRRLDQHDFLFLSILIVSWCFFLFTSTCKCVCVSIDVWNNGACMSVCIFVPGECLYSC